MTAYR